MNRRSILKSILLTPVLSLLGISNTAYSYQKQSIEYGKNSVEFDIKYIIDKRPDVIGRAFSHVITNNPNAKRIKIEVY